MQKRALKRALSFFLSLVMVACLGQPAMPASAQGNIPITLQTGHAPQYDHLQYDAGTAGALYVNQYTTKPHVRRTDLTLGGNRMPVQIEFWYDEENLGSDLTALANPYGFGWMNAYNQILEYRSSDEQYAFRNANGTWIYFEDSGELTDDNASIWTEAAPAEEMLTGAVLYLEEDSLYTDITSVTIEQEDNSLHFDAAGRLISIIDAYNNTLSITYVNQSGPAISMITDGVGRCYVFTYSNGWLSSVACQDGQGNPIVVQNAAITINYTIANGMLVEASSGANYSYDGSRRITSFWGQDGIGFALTYATGTQEVTSVSRQAAMDTGTPLTGTVTEITKSNNEVVVTEGNLEQVQSYDLFGRPVTYEINQMEEENGIAVSHLLYGFNYIYENVLQPNGNYISQLADIEFFDNTSLNDLSNEPDEPETVPEVPEEDPEEPEEDQEEFGSYTETRDQYGNITSETHTVPEGNSDLVQTTLYTYSSDGNYLTSVTNEDGIITTYSYNSLSGILQSVTDGLNHTTAYSYNALRELTAAALPVTGLSDDTGMSAAYSYENGRISTIEYGAFTYSFTYDAWGNITEVEVNDDPLITYNYGDSADEGQVQSLTYGNGQQVFYSYNSRNQITGIGYTNQLNRFAYSYTEEGKLASVEDTLTGQTTQYTETGTELYDSEDNLLFSLEAGEDEGTILKTVFGVSWNYAECRDPADANRTLFTICRENNECVNGYSEQDTLGRRKKTCFSASGAAYNEEITYNLNNNGEGSLVSNYEVTAANNIAETALFGEYTYLYDANANIIQEIRSFEKTTQIPIDPPVIPPIGPAGSSGESNSLNPIVDSDIWDISDSISYSYDEAGQLTGASGSRSLYSYTYDKSGNLASSECRINTSSPSLPINRWALTEKSFTYNAKGQLIGFDKAASSQTMHRAYTLDTMGNPLSMTTSFLGSTSNPVTKNLTWGAGRMLTGVITDTDNYVYYTYNTDGLRIKKTVCNNGLEQEYKYLWDDGRLITEYSLFRTITILYDSNNCPIGFTIEANGGFNQNVAKYYYLKNLQGDVTHILNEYGEVVVSYTYDPWGNQTVRGNTAIAASNPCTYRGYYYDRETGWYYLQSRYYDPEIGRFLNADEAAPALITGNAFAYCLNNPVNNKDKNGQFGTPIQWACAVIGGIVGWSFGDYVARFIGLSPNGSFWSRTVYWAVRSLVVAGGAVAGYVAGAKLIGIIKQYIYNKGLLYRIPSALRWFLGLGADVGLANKLFQAYQTHIFTLKHGWDSIIKTGISKRQIFDTIFSKIQQLITYASNGSNEIRTFLWGRQVTIRFYYSDGIINSIDAFIGWSSRIIGHYIKGY